MDVRVEHVHGRAFPSQPARDREGAEQVGEPDRGRPVGETKDSQRAVLFLGEREETADAFAWALVDEDDDPVPLGRRGAGVIPHERA